VGRIVLCSNAHVFVVFCCRNLEIISDLLGLNNTPELFDFMVSKRIFDLLFKIICGCNKLVINKHYFWFGYRLFKLAFGNRVEKFLNCEKLLQTFELYKVLETFELWENF
jgi:hypothetical protein